MIVMGLFDSFPAADPFLNVVRTERRNSHIAHKLGERLKDSVAGLHRFQRSLSFFEPSVLGKQAVVDGHVRSALRNEP